MRYIALILLSLSSLFAGDACNDPLYDLLKKKHLSLSSSLSKHLSDYHLEQFGEQEKSWNSAAHLCQTDNCDCLIDEYQKHNVALSEQLKKILSESKTKIIAFTGQDTECGFSKPFPDDMVVFAAGSHTGMPSKYRIGEKGENASIFRVVVNSPKHPVALILGTYDAAIWDISWTEGTKIEAAYVMGYHEQAVAGLPKTTPVSMITIDKKWGCGSFTIQEESLNQINPLSNKLFKKNADKVFFASKGALHLGDPINEDELLFTSSDTPLQSLHRANAPLQKEEGIQDAVKKGILRPIKTEDLQRWLDTRPRDKNLPIIATPNIPKRKPFVHNGFLILKPFVIPEGLYGGHAVTFFLDKGVPAPTGNLGHSSLYDFNTMTCKGVLCNVNLTGY